MRQLWWISSMWQAIKKVQSWCNICKKLQGKPHFPPDLPPFPDFRVRRTEPYQVTSVDYTGLIQVRKSSSGVRKVYAILFTCAVTRAIHTELVDDWSSERFLHALRRFTSRNEFPQILLSDNATQFVNASNYLQNFMDNPEVPSLEEIASGILYQRMRRGSRQFGREQSVS